MTLARSVHSRRVDRVASVLRSYGVGPGRRVAVQAHPDADGVAALLGSGATGALVSPIGPRWADEERARALDLLEPHLVIVGAGVDSPPLSSGRVVLRTAALEREARELRDAGTGVQPSASAKAPEARWLLWTSGTTGAPRGVVLDHSCFRVSAKAVAVRLGLSASDRWLASLSFAHVGGLALLLRARMLGSGIVAAGSFDPGVFSEVIEREEITHASLVPTQLGRVLDVRKDRPFPPSFRLLLVGGAAISSSLLRRALAARVPMALTWGMTETASQVATAPPPLVREKPGTVGPPLDGMEVEDDPDTGELRVRGPTLTEGEFRGPEAPPSPLTDRDGWFRTGDVGWFDHDAHLWITGRISTRIISGGVTIEPGEVEEVLHDHPGVEEVAVTGMPDEEWGERLVAVVVPVDLSRPPSLDALREFARERLSSPKLPRELKVVAALPRTRTGKTDRKRLSKVAASASSGDPAP